MLRLIYMIETCGPDNCMAPQMLQIVWCQLLKSPEQHQNSTFRDSDTDTIALLVVIVQVGSEANIKSRE
jgi:hypothetical protein